MPLLLSPSTTAEDGPLSIEVDGLLPHRVADLARAVIERLPVVADGRPCRLGDLFAVTGDAADGQIECVGDFSRVHRLAPPCHRVESWCGGASAGTRARRCREAS